jgi:glycerol-3-phosphate dehydrogenase (NAD(P)+)
LYRISKVAVIGAGSWGCSISCLLHKNGNDVTLYHYNSEFVEYLSKKRTHPQLPSMPIDPEIVLTSDKSQLNDADYIFIAVPTQSIRSLLETTDIPSNAKIVSLSKGIERESHMLPSQIILETTNHEESSLCALSGPSHAEEVARGIPTTVVVAGSNMTLNRNVQDLLSSTNLRAYSNSDLLGVEMAGAIKNVISIASGMCIGLGFGDNTTAALITRGLNEISRLGRTLGAEESTFYGLAGIGDLSVTAFSKHSRNRNFGIEVGKGRKPKEVISESRMVVEGYYTAEALHSIAIDKNVEMPISQSVYKILYENLSPKQAIMDLMSRDLTHENN